MKTTKIGNLEVELYDAIDELPIARFHAYNKALLIDAGIGSDLADWDTHIEKTIRFIRVGKPDLAEKELDNLRQNVYFVQTDMSPRYLAFCALVRKVNGTEYNDLSPDGLAKVLELFKDTPNGELTAQLEAVKKKIDEELQLYLTTLLLTYTKPQSFSGSDSVEIQYDKQFENMCLMLSQHLHVNPKTFTVLEYYNAFEYIKQTTKQAKAKAGKN